MEQSAQEVFAILASRTDWFRKSYQAREFAWHVQVWAVQKMMQRYSWGMHMGGAITEQNGMQHWLWNVAEMKRAREEFLNRVLHDDTFLDHFESDFFVAWDAYVAEEKEYTARYASRSPQERIQALHALCEAESNVGAVGYMNDIFLTDGASDWLLEWCIRELPQDIPQQDQCIADLCTPVEMSFVQRQHMELMAIGLQPKSLRDELLVLHQTKWHWVENSYVESLPLSVQFFADKLNDMITKGEVTQERYEQLQASVEQKTLTKRSIVSTHALSSVLQKIIECSDRISHITDIRKMGVLRLNGLIWECFRDVSAATGIPFTTLAWSTPMEIRQLFSANDWSRVHERQQAGAITLVYNGGFEMIQGKAFTALNLTPFFGDTTGQTALKGQVACFGVVTGPARIIRGRNDFALFHDGDVLITSQTTPEFIPLMKRASAVVTEQGGITCHAAIVSRELKVPCIIGCASAMTFFHDGDQIVVDGQTGEVHYA